MAQEVFLESQYLEGGKGRRARMFIATTTKLRELLEFHFQGALERGELESGRSAEELADAAVTTLFDEAEDMDQPGGG